MKKIIRLAGLIIWLVLPFFLLFQPAGYFDRGNVLCPSKHFLHTSCPGCGLTRATQHFLHFDFAVAWDFNKLVVITFPVCVLVYIHVLGKFAGKSWFSFLGSFYRSDKSRQKK
jgi:hypothetical protein